MNDRYKLRDLIGDDKRLMRFDRFMDPAGLVLGGKITPHWMRDGKSFWFAEGIPYDTVIFRVDGETGKVEPLLDVTKTRHALEALLSRDLPYTGLPFESVVDLGDDAYQFCFEEDEYIVSSRSHLVESVRGKRAGLHGSGVLHVDDVAGKGMPRSYRRPMWLMEPMLATEAPSPDRHWFASVQNGNIMLRASVDDRTVALTSDGTPDFAWDIEAPRYRGLAGMAWRQHLLNPWSPDGNKLFAIKVDRRAVPELPFIRYLKREEELCSHKFQRAGGPIDIGHPHIVDVLAKSARPFDLGNTEDYYFTLVSWLPDGSEVLFTRHSRNFKTVDLLAGNPWDGTVRTIFSESARTFVAIQHDVIMGGDNHITILSDRPELIWRSARSGWNHFYLYTLDGAMVRALTTGDFPVIDVVAIDEDADWVYFTAHHDQDRPYDTHLCRVKLSGGEIQRLTQFDGENAVSISPSKKTFTVVNSRPDRAYRSDFHACDGRHLASVQQANMAPLKDFGYVASEEFTVMAADGETILWGVMHKPGDFDPTKKYPVIDHLYGGPQVSMVAHRFDFGEEDSQKRLDYALAQLGYIVISVDARGTPERSKAFHDVVYGNWGRHEIPDHVATLKQLAQRHDFIDLDRVGVFGHSWGGYFTIRALAQAPEIFRVGVASAPGMNPYDMILYEPYLDVPTRAKAAYDYANNYHWASKITGKLMLVAGTSDAARPGIVMKTVHYLIEAGIDHELVVLPEAGHSFQGKDEEYFIRKLVSQFEVHLKPRRGRTTSLPTSRNVRRAESVEYDFRRVR